MKNGIYALAAMSLLLAAQPTMAAEDKAVSFSQMKNSEKPIRADISSSFNYAAKTMEVKGAKLQYFDKGVGDPVIFLHGIPSWSYLWRNVMPHMEKDARVIALDLPGYGGSERGPKGHPAKTLVDHIDYFEAFVEKMGLKNITLVIHDLGGGVGLAYAGRHPENVRAIAFGESPLAQSFTDKPLVEMIFPRKLSEQSKGFYELIRNKAALEKMVVLENSMVPGDLMYGLTRQMTDEEINAYRQPFEDPARRYAISDVMAGITLDGLPSANFQEINRGLKWLVESDVPKLIFQVEDGNLMNDDLIKRLRQKLDVLTVVNLGPGRHFFQEDHPHKVGRHLRAWYQGFNQPKLETR